MTLSEYLNMLFPFFGDRGGFGQTPKTKKGRGKADFVTFILGAYVEEGYETECKVLDLRPDTLRKIMSGASPFSAVNAIPFNRHPDKERFVEVLSEDAQSFDSLVALSKALADHGIVNDGSLSDILVKCADALEQIIMETATPKGKRDFNDACDAVEQALRRMPRPDMQDPPDELAEHEQAYIEALYAAYGDAAKVDVFDHSSLASYPEYDEDLKERRIDYFAAESIRCSIIELQGADLQDQFSVLKSEMYAGVRNTAIKRYDDGFERMLSVMDQATVTPVDQYVLSRSPYWINNRIKQGVCHFLVTDGKLRWVKRNG
ncbi:MAG: ABC-three component system protein [Christensenellales bacterium]|nr:ABC-three component system protein [Christensenellales bacterium]